MPVPLQLREIRHFNYRNVCVCVCVGTRQHQFKDNSSQMFQRYLKICKKWHGPARFFHSSGSSVGISPQLHRTSSGDLQKRKKKQKNEPSAVQRAEQIKGNLSVSKILYLSVSLLLKG